MLLTVSLIDRAHDSSKTIVVYIFLKTTRLMRKCVDNNMIFICSIKFFLPMKITGLVAFEMLQKIKYAGV